MLPPDNLDIVLDFPSMKIAMAEELLFQGINDGPVSIKRGVITRAEHFKAMPTLKTLIRNQDRKGPLSMRRVQLHPETQDKHKKMEKMKEAVTFITSVVAVSMSLPCMYFLLLL